MSTTRKAVAPLRVLIADDHPTILQMVRKILDEHPNLSVVGEAADGTEAVELAEELRPDVVVINVTMPKMSGFEAARRIHEKTPLTSIVILSTHKDASFIAMARQSGATGYVSKSAAANDLVRAIETTTAGGEFFVA